MKILVAEDDAVSRTILRRAVEKLGHECLTAEDGQRAWDLYCAAPDVDVVISDWMMPVLDGLELCRGSVPKSAATATGTPTLSF